MLRIGGIVLLLVALAFSVREYVEGRKLQNKIRSIHQTLDSNAMPRSAGERR